MHQTLNRLGKNQKHNRRDTIKRLSSERKTQERIIEGLRIKAAKINNPLEQQQLIVDIADKEANLLAVPCEPTLFINDVTPESLAYLVHEQQGRLAIFSDEGGILETLAGLYHHGMANVDILLKGIDGGEVRIRRKDCHIRLNPYLTVVLAVQPAILQNMAEKRAYLGNGTLERFLYVLPKSNLGFRTHDKPAVSAAAQADYHRKITELLKQQEQAGEGEDKNIHRHVLKLSSTAHHSWREFQARVEKELRPEGRLIHCLGWGGKICGFALRIAGLLHVAGQEISSLIITEDTMNNALAISHALIEHAIAAFSVMGVDQTTDDAKTILNWLQTNRSISFRQTELVLAMRNRKLGKPERLSKALVLLNQRNIISPPIKLTYTRKPIHHLSGS